MEILVVEGKKRQMFCIYLINIGFIIIQILDIDSQ